MDLGVVSTAVGLAMTLTGAIGGLLLKAYINPVKQKTELNEKAMNELEDRVRQLEYQSSAHSIHLENLMKAVDRLVNKIDELVSLEHAERSRHNSKE